MDFETIAPSPELTSGRGCSLEKITGNLQRWSSCSKTIFIIFILLRREPGGPPCPEIGCNCHQNQAHACNSWLEFVGIESRQYCDNERKLGFQKFLKFAASCLCHYIIASAGRCLVSAPRIHTARCGYVKDFPAPQPNLPCRPNKPRSVNWRHEGK